MHTDKPLDFRRLPLDGLWGRVSPPFRLAFLSALLVGFVTHLYMFSNLLLNHDSTNSIYSANDVLSSGRWAAQLLSAFSGYFQLPVVIGLISVVMLALTAGLTVRILGLRTRAGVVVASALLVTFPSVACIFSYLFTADAYFIALFFSALSVYCAKFCRRGWIAAVALLTVACGTYQAFVCYAIGLFLFDCLLMLLEGAPIPQVVRKGLVYVGICVASLALYYLILQVLLAVTGTALEDYQGMGGMSLSNLGAFLAQIPKAWLLFGAFFFDTGYFSPFFRAVQLLCCLFFAGAGLWLLQARKLWRDVPRLLLLFAGLLLIPLALNFITVLALGAEVHALMIYSFVLFLVLVVKEAELILDTSGGRRSMCCFFTGLALCALVVWGNFCATNAAYLRLQVRYETSYAAANRIVARIEALEGYTPDTPVAFAGRIPSGMFGMTVEEFSRIDSLTGTDDNLLLNAYSAPVFIETYIGLHLPAMTDAQWNMVYGSGILEQMPSYPAEGSVILVDGVVIVKLGET